uniref:Uncharacterized protein n=1 Tax=uncultured marine virus TaxID=186617 RepID=A0A0F7L2T0_9VIRU|nr:hypothetical protein [uncultured marine virus]
MKQTRNLLMHEKNHTRHASFQRTGQKWEHLPAISGSGFCSQKQVLAVRF